MAQKNQKKAISRHLIGASSLVGAMTLLSRVSGMIRDIIFAHLFLYNISINIDCANK